jgi:hypothetical protein
MTSLKVSQLGLESRLTKQAYLALHLNNVQNLIEACTVLYIVYVFTCEYICYLGCNCSHYEDA